MRKIGLVLLLLGIGAVVAHYLGLALPTLRWFYGFADAKEGLESATWWQKNSAEVIGGILSCLAIVAGAVLLLRRRYSNPHTERQIKRFQSMGRGWVSFRVLLLLVVLAMMDQILVGKRALVVNYEDGWYFPAFAEAPLSKKFFGGSGEEEVNYRELKKRFASASKGNWVLMPPVPYDPTFDSDNELRRPLEVREGLVYREGSKEPYSGLGYCYYPDDLTRRYSMQKYRKGVEQGREELYGRTGDLAVVYDWKNGVRADEPSMGAERVASFADVESTRLYAVTFAPLPPSWESGHYLGTDSRGWDVIAQLFGGLQVVMKAAVIYLIVTYSVGLTLGCLMGYFGGLVDIILQRFIEVLANVPFLYVVIIIADRIGRDRIDLITILLVICIFSWIGASYYMRTATYREKAKDYVAAARLLGASPFRVIFRHILPNAISIVVTLLPFSVAAIITSLTALDFIGFGLPEKYPSWGRLLSDGVTNIDYPWIVSAVFVGMVTVLLLVTFVGEAVREAFDPKKFTTYR
jgi:microcin C transport system permease protein